MAAMASVPEDVDIGCGLSSEKHIELPGFELLLLLNWGFGRRDDDDDDDDDDVKLPFQNETHEKARPQNSR